MREPDGLAMSSRNAYLTGEERTTAAALPRVMQEASARIAAGERISATVEDARQALIAAGLASVDYVAVRRADTLAPFGGDTAPVGVTGRLLIAARLGKTRLIDNVGFVRKA
jgi:pantoate--beta-alanine ligase